MKDGLISWWAVVLMAIFFGVVLPAILGGCAHTDREFISQPDNKISCTVVIWASQEEIDKQCAKGSAACGSVGRPDTVNFIWAPKPKSFDDFWSVYLLGEEFLHNLGATHK